MEEQKDGHPSPLDKSRSFQFTFKMRRIHGFFSPLAAWASVTDLCG